MERADQLRTYYEHGHHSVKWYHQFYHHEKEVGLLNAFIVDKEFGNLLNAVAFRKKVVEGLFAERAVQGRAGANTSHASSK